MSTSTLGRPILSTLTAAPLWSVGREQAPLPFKHVSPILPEARERENTGAIRDRSARFLQALTEVIYAERPLRQLGGWLTLEVYQQLLDHLEHSQPNNAGTQRGARIASVHVSSPRPGAAELTGRIVHAGRSHAIAVRLDQLRDHHGRVNWKCSAVTWA